MWGFIIKFLMAATYTFLGFYVYFEPKEEGALLENIAFLIINISLIDSILIVQMVLFVKMRFWISELKNFRSSSV